METFFADAERAQSLLDDGFVALDEQHFDGEIAAQVHHAWKRWCITQNKRTHGHSLSGQQCIPSACKATRVHVTLYRTSVELNTESGAVVRDQYKLMNRACHKTHRLHACTQYCMEKASLHLHDTPVDEHYTTSGALDAHGGVLYWCEKHAKMHHCGPWCTETFTDSLGFVICVLSNKYVGASVRASFGDGTRTNGTDVTSTSSALNSTKRTSHQLNNEGPHKRLRAGENLLDTHAKRSRQYYKEAQFTDTLPADYPHEELFAHCRTDSVFGVRNVDIVSFYAQAYTIVHRILFSAERDAIEANNVSKTHTNTTSKMSGYLREETRANRPIFINITRQICDKERTLKRTFPRILVPKRSVQRLVAYYSMCAVEFYVQLSQALLRVPNKSKALLSIAQKFIGYAFSSIVPVLLSMQRRNVTNASYTLVHEDWFVKSMFPESSTLNTLGYTQKVCTDVKKHISKALSYVIDKRLTPVHRLEMTLLHFNELIDYKRHESVVKLFIEKRAARLGAHEHVRASNK